MVMIAILSINGIAEGNFRVDLSLSTSEKALRDEVRSWLKEHVPSEPLPPPSTVEGLAEHRKWERTLASAGLAAVQWPREHGGRGLNPMSSTIFYAEYVAAGAPDRLNRIGLGLCGPTLIEWGTPEQQERWLRRILTCEDLWCQGFSEPDAGSDLAALRTRGTLTSDGVIVNGQKVWTSHSQNADWMFALVRTDPESARHAGITLVMIDMTSPGVDVRPIRQIHGGSEFSEVFFTDVFVPTDCIVGPVGEGWKVAMSTLRHERGSGLNTPDHFERLLREVTLMIPADLREDAAVLERLGMLVEEVRAYRAMSMRTVTEMSENRQLGPQALMGKLWWSNMQSKIYEFGKDMQGLDALRADGSDEGNQGFEYRYWMSHAAHIYAGTDEIQRDQIAERGLRLPRGARNAS